MKLFSRLAALAALTALAACAAPDDLSKPPAPLGNFQLGYTIVVADSAEPVGPSRKATADEWEASLKTAVVKRIGRYQGGKLYHLGIGVNAYALAVPGVPVVLSPKSVVVVTVDVWDDTLGRIVNAESKRFTVFEGLSGSTVIGSGLTKTREEQMQTLSENAAREIDKWLVENKAWFSPEAARARALLPPPLAKPGAAPGPVAPKPAASK